MTRGKQAQYCSRTRTALAIQRPAFLRGAAFTGFPLQKSTICRVASAWVADTWRFAAAVACPRATPTALFAELSHMLIRGFFFVQGLPIGAS